MNGHSHYNYDLKTKSVRCSNCYMGGSFKRWPLTSNMLPPFDIT